MFVGVVAFRYQHRTTCVVLITNSHKHSQSPLTTFLTIVIVYVKKELHYHCIPFIKVVQSVQLFIICFHSVLATAYHSFPILYIFFNSHAHFCIYLVFLDGA